MQSSHYRSSPRSQSRGAFYLALAMLILPLTLVFCRPSFAVWIAPSRPLSQDDLLAVSVSRSDAIGVGILTAAGDTTNAQYLDITPTQWIKGDYDLRPIRLGFSWDSPPTFSRAQALLATDSITVIFFARYHNNVGWILSDSPYDYSGGLVPFTARTWPERHATVQSAISRLGLDSLAASADVIVLAHAADSAMVCSFDDPTSVCMPMVVDSVISGEVSAPVIPVAFVLPGDFVSGEVLMSLRRLASGAYEPIGSRAGSMAVRDSVVVPLGIRLDAALHAARAAHNAGHVTSGASR